MERRQRQVMHLLRAAALQQRRQRLGLAHLVVRRFAFQQRSFLLRWHAYTQSRRPHRCGEKAVRMCMFPPPWARTQIMIISAHLDIVSTQQV